MTYDPEKYREKREKVLGIKKRGLGFGVVAAGVSLVILLGLGAVTVPQALSYMASRYLDDVIFKLESEMTRPEMVREGMRTLEGVKRMDIDKESTRIVVTYDHRVINVSAITNRLKQQGLAVTVLNRVGHHQHQATLKSEEEEIETP